jgi:hypothetical protein
MNKVRKFYVSLGIMSTAVFVLVFLLTAFSSKIPAEEANSRFTEGSEVKLEYDVSAMSKERIDGVAFTAPDRYIPESGLATVTETQADWVCIIPYAFCRPGNSMVWFNSPRQWWGERSEGVIAQIEYAQNQGLKVLLKPHIWVGGQGWLGEFDMENTKAWEEWEANYSKYILHYARIADSINVELFCVGTEAKAAVKARPRYWSGLIDEVREVYEGPMTYAANWDNYQNIPFWYKLDFIGIDAYFPIHEDINPSLEELMDGWKPWSKKIRQMAQSTGKPILFTEYGYLSVDQTAWRNWELEAKLRTLRPNMEAQKLAYEALFKTFWNEDWFAGGFLWKWYYQEGSGGVRNNDYTPQGKPVMSLIQEYYQESQ